MKHGCQLNGCFTLIIPFAIIGIIKFGELVYGWIF